MRFSTGQKKDFLQRGFSRRSFGRLATMLVAGSALPFYNEFTLAQESDSRRPPPGAVKIDQNENPLGPCPEAAEAIHNVVENGGRYMFELPAALQRTMAEIEGLEAN